MATISPRTIRILGLVPIVLACVALVGWQFRIPLLKADLFGTFVAPNAALCFIVCGVSIVCQISGSRVVRAIGLALSGFVLLFATATMAEYVFGVDLGIDRLFFAHRLSDWTLPFPGRFAFNTALAFTSAGVSLLTIRRRNAVAELSAGLVLVVFYLALVGRAYSATLLYSRVMSPYTAILFGFLGVALLCAAARHSFVDAALSQNAGGIVFRRMLIAVLVGIPLLGITRVQLEQRGLIKADIATPLFVIITVAFFTILTMHTSTLLNQLDKRRQQAETALIQTEKLAAAGRMAATVAHEINNPLEAVTNLLYLLKDGKADATVTAQYIRLAQQELARVAAITRRTLGFYREERRPSNVDLGQVMDGILELYAHRLASANVEVNRSYAQGAFVRVPEGEIRQVLTNLLSNALDALPPGSGRIDISVQDGEHVVFTFADNGSGISQEHMPRIFEPFFTTKRDVGNGLGLWVSKTLVEKNEGRIEMTTHTDAEHHGTSFKLVFPRASREKGSERVPSAQGAGAAD
jgi:signal transduction histidine kinase